MILQTEASSDVKQHIFGCEGGGSSGIYFDMSQSLLAEAHNLYVAYI